jgi:hypothetical protein
MVTPEGCIKSACLKYLQKQGITSWNNPSGAVQIRPGHWLHFGKKGSADILGCLPGGRFLAVECKAKDGRLSPEQKQFLAVVETLGGLALVVRDWKELDHELRAAGYVSDPFFNTSCMTCK